MGVGARPVLALGGGSEWVLLAGLLLIILALLMTLRKKRRTISGPNLTAREHLGRLKEEQGLRSDLESLMVDIEQLAKRLGSQLDAKVIQVEKLVAEADRRIEILRNLKATPPAGNDGATQAAPLTAPPDPLTQSVYDLADAGKSPPEIASETGEHLGKVELILALRRAEQRG